MVGGTYVPQAKSEPHCKCGASDLEMKIRMICNRRSLSAIVCDLGFAVINCEHHSAADHIHEHGKGMTTTTSIITKKQEGEISKLEKQLIMHTDAQIQKCVVS
jgi:hypothetical protein